MLSMLVGDACVVHCIIVVMTSVTVKNCMFLSRLCIFYAIVFYTVLHFTNEIVKKVI